MAWKINKNGETEIHINFSDDGNFKTKEDAVNVATQIARENKMRIIIHSNPELDQSDNTNDIVEYTSFLNVNELLDKTLSEFKLAKAEMQVALISLKKNKESIVLNHDPEQHMLLRQKSKEIKKNIKHCRYNLKETKKRYNMAYKNKNNNQIY